MVKLIDFESEIWLCILPLLLMRLYILEQVIYPVTISFLGNRMRMIYSICFRVVMRSD